MEGRQFKMVSKVSKFQKEKLEAVSIPQLRAEEFCRMIQTNSLFSSKAENDLLSENYNLVRYVASRIKKSVGGEFEDLCQEAAIGMLRAARTYDPLKGAFSTYAYMWMWSAASRAAKKERKHSSALSLDAEYDDGKDSMLEYIPSECDVESEIECKEELQTLIDTVAKLKPEMQRVLQLRFGLGGNKPQTLKEISELLGITPEAVRQRVNRGVNNLKKLMVGVG